MLQHVWGNIYSIRTFVKATLHLETLESRMRVSCGSTPTPAGFNPS